ncbi:MAG: hypothetical protein AAF862_08140 [Pseudomonadota bacterium]
MPLDQAIQDIGHAASADGEVCGGGMAHAAEVIDHVKQPETAAG